MLTLDDVRFETTRTLQCAGFAAHKKEIPSGVCFDCGAELFDGGELDACPQCGGTTIGRSDAEIMGGRNVTIAMKRSRSAVKVADIMAERFGYVPAFPTVSPLKKVRASSVDATRPAGAFPTFAVEWDSVFPAPVAELIGVSTVAELFPGATLAKRCPCGTVFASSGDRCEACESLHAEALAENQKRSAPFDADAFFTHLDRMDAFEDWMDAIGGGEALAEMDDDTIAMLAKLDAVEAAAELAGRQGRQQRAGA